MQPDTEDVYEMKSKLFEFSEVVKHENYGIKKYKHCVYKGQIEGRKR